jgi:hypothetical protein
MLASRKQHASGEASRSRHELPADRAGGLLLTRHSCLPRSRSTPSEASSLPALAPSFVRRSAGARGPAPALPRPLAPNGSAPSARASIRRPRVRATPADQPAPRQPPSPRSTHEQTNSSSPTQRRRRRRRRRCYRRRRRRRRRHSLHDPSALLAATRHNSPLARAPTYVHRGKAGARSADGPPFPRTSLPSYSRIRGFASPRQTQASDAMHLHSFART